MLDGPKSYRRACLLHSRGKGGYGLTELVIEICISGQTILHGFAFTEFFMSKKSDTINPKPYISVDTPPFLPFSYFVTCLASFKKSVLFLFYAVII